MRRTAATLLLIGLAGGCGGPAGGPDPPDLILVNGTVLTVAADDRIAEGLAVRDGEIVAVGSSGEIDALAGPATQRIDLEGRTATPGLIDAHVHFASSGVSRLTVTDLSYPAVRSIEDVVERVEARVAEASPGEWIRGRGWDEGKLEELRYIYASDLDKISPENPVWLTHTMGHYGVANSLALRLAEVTSRTVDPPGGTIDRAADGSPTGVLKESAQRLVTSRIPGASAQQRVDGIREMVRAFNAEGMTGAKDPGISESVWEAYQQVRSSGGLSVRLFALWRGGRTVDSTRQLLERITPFTRPADPAASNHLVSGGVKLYADGSGGARTAWLYEDWNRESTEVDTGNRGYPAYDPDVLRTQIRMIHDAGIHISTHSIGDRAIDWTIDSYWEALQANPTPNLRHGIIHMNIPTDHAIARTAEMQQRFEAAYPEPSATFMWWIGDTYAGNFGPDRARRLNPFRTFLDRGIRWAGGSDYSVTPFAARYGIWASVARETALGVYGAHPWGTDESVDVRTALRSFTIWAAHQLFLEDQVGSIEVGKRADIAVWDRNPYEVPTAELKDMACQLTLFDGRIVFER